MGAPTFSRMVETTRAGRDAEAEREFNAPVAATLRDATSGQFQHSRLRLRRRGNGDGQCRFGAPRSVRMSICTASCSAISTEAPGFWTKLAMSAVMRSPKLCFHAVPSCPFAAASSVMISRKAKKFTNAMWPFEKATDLGVFLSDIFRLRALPARGWNGAGSLRSAWPRNHSTCGGAA